MRKHGKRDLNQQRIIQTLRAVGCSVLDMADLGGGAPDFAAAWKGTNFFFECKQDEKSKLTEAEKKFHATWRGQIAVITTANEVLEIIGAVVNKNNKDGKGR